MAAFLQCKFKFLLNENTKTARKMASIKGTRTEQNLLASFAGESQARSRYTYFAAVARQEGYEQIAATFAETAEQELQHAGIFFGYLEGGAMTSITASYPAGVVGTTEENLRAAAEGEYEEWHELYAEGARIADEEGFAQVAESFRQIAKVEVEHEKRYRKLLERLTDENGFFHRDEATEWQCRNCGYVTGASTESPKFCPACKVSQQHFEPKRNNY